MNRKPFLFVLFLTLFSLFSCSDMYEDLKNLTRTQSWKIENYFEPLEEGNIDTSKYVLDDSKTKTNRIKDWREIEPAAFTGFSFVKSEPVQTENSRTLKVYYKRNLITVTFDPNGGKWTDAEEGEETSIKTVSFKYGTTITAPEASSLTREGQIFSEWSGFTDTKDLTENASYYATWTDDTPPAVYTVTFDANASDAEGSTGPQIFTEKVSQALTPNDFTRAGYKFTGWALSSDGIKVYENEEEITAAADMTLYAVWIPKDAHSITYINVPSGVENSNPQSYKEIEDVTLYALTRGGYDFEGWYFGEDASGTKTTGWKAHDYTEDIELYANWTAKTYKVIFDANGGSGTMSAQTFTYGTAAALNKNVFTAPTGYSFGGWAVSASGARVYDDGAAYPADVTEAYSSEVTLYAVWIEKGSHTITYNLDGGDNNGSNKSEFKEAADVTLYDASKEGYEFNGWYEASDFSGSRITGWAAGERTENVTVYAKFTAKKYTVKFNANGGTGTMSDEEFTFGTPQALTINSFERIDYSFNGWATAAGGDVVYSDKASYPNDEDAKTYKESVTLYAVWMAKDAYKITYNLNGGSNGEGNPSAFKESETVTLNDASKEGYDFDGWYETSDFSGSSISTWTGKKSDVTLYAKWIAKTYTVKFDANGTNTSGTMADEEFTFGTPQTLTANSFTRLDYTFAGWSTDKDASTVGYADKAEFSSSSYLDTVTLYAVWTAKAAHTISYELNGGTNSGSNKATFKEADTVTFADATKDGYTFDGWYTTQARTTRITGWAAGEKLSDVTVYAGWTAKKYTVRFDANGTNTSGTMADEEFTFGTAKALTANSFTRLDYTFGGWSTDKNATKATYSDKESISYTPYSDTVTLYAVWNAKGSHNITYANMEGATNSTSNPDTFKESDAVTLSNPSVNKSGYDFAGWYSDSGLTTKTTGWAKGTYSADVVVYAAWTAKNYTVKFDANGTNTSGTMADQTFTYTVAQALTANSFTRLDYTFAGWSTDKNASAAAYVDKSDFSLTDYASTVTLYAVWKEKAALNITYANMDGATNSTSNKATFKEADSVTLSNPSVNKTGYDFGGWYYDSGLTTKITGWAAGEKTADVTVYAKWTGKSYTVSFDMNASEGTETSGTMVSQTFTFGDAAKALTANAYTQTGFTFKGWSEAKDSSSVEYADKADFALKTAANVTLYAVWIENAAHKINYYDGSSLMSSVEFKEKDAVTLDTSKTKTGYTFAAWYSNSGLTTKITGWAAGEKLGDVNVYAKWTANTYTVTFDKNGGSGTMSDESFTYGTAKALTANTFTRGGYDFGGWAETSGGAASFADGDSYSIGAGNTTLYAVWIEHGAHTITYVGPDSTTGFVTSFKETEAITLPSSAVKDGYTFGGWYTDSACTSGKEITGWTAETYSADVTVYAKFTAKTYTVTFNKNGGSGTMSSETFTFDTAKALTANSFTRLDYTFAGWSTSSGATTADYADKADFNYKPYTSSVNLYAVWNAKEAHNITYNNMSGATNSVSNKQTFKEADAVTLYNATKDGYDFGGWYTDEGLTSKITGWAAGEKLADVTVYAKWTVKTYTVKFDANGTNTSGTMADETFTFGTAKALTANSFTRLDYTFAGWSTSSGAAAATYLDKADFSYTPYSSTVTLYAVWNAKAAHSITYANMDGATNSSSNASTFKEADKVTLSNPSANKDGYDFAGWYSDSGLTSKITGWAAGEKLGDVTVYAKWTAKTYTVKFSANGTNTSGTMADEEFTFGTAKALTKNSFTRLDYTFAGWSTSSGAKTAAYLDEADFSYTPYASTVTLYAVWNEKAAHTISYNLNGGTNSDSNKATFKEADTVTLADATKDGYTFDGWYTTEARTTKITGWAAGEKLGDVSVYAGWTAKKYTVTFDANGDNTSGTMADETFTYGTAKALTANSFTRLDYTFAGWSTSSGATKADYTDKGNFSYTPYSSTVTLYAVWNKNSAHNITYANMDGATNSTSNPQTFWEADAVTFVNPSANKDGYDFGGWYSDSGLTTKITGWSKGTYSKDVTVYAKWTGKSYTVSFDMNASEGTETSGTMTSQTFTFGDAAKALTANAYTQTGYSFKGWTKTKGSSSIDYTDKAGFALTAYASSVTLYAVWTENAAHKINYYDGSSLMSSVEFKEKDAVTLDTSKTKTGYTFAAWYSNSGLTTKITGWAAGEKTADVNVYAKWTANTYTVTFDKNGGSGTMGTQTFTYGTAANLNANAFTRTGYTFGGWSTSAGGAVSYADKASYSIGAGNATLYAVWTERPAHTISYVGPDSTSGFKTSFKETETVTLPSSAAKDGYTFGGWYTDSACTSGKEITGWAAGEKTGDVTVYGKFTAKTYTVSFDANGTNTSGTMSDESFTFGTAKALTANSFTRLDYTFGGWATAKDGGKAYDDGASFSLASYAETTTLYAYWVAKDPHSITYSNMTGAVNNASNTATFKEADSVTLYNPSKDGYTFGGWYTDSACTSGKEITGWSAGEKLGDVTVYAKWTANTYTITFHANDGTSSSSTTTQSATYNASVTLTANGFERTGYKFGGWAAAADGDIVYGDKAAFTYTTAENSDLYAKWNLATYNVTFNANGGSGTMADEVFTYSVAKALTKNAFTRENFTFAGWSTDKDAKTAAYADGADFTIGAENVTLYAIWNSGINGTVAEYTGSDITVVQTKNADSTTTLTATPPYGDADSWTYTWYIDGEAQSEDTKSITKSLDSGTHQVTVTAELDGDSRTDTFRVTVD